VEAKRSTNETSKGAWALWTQKLSFTWLGISLLCIVPALLFGSGLFSVGVLLAAVLIGIPYALFAAVTKKDSRNRVFRCLAIMLALPALTLAYVSRIDTQIPENATPLTRAIESFRQDTGQYPESLEALIPKHMAELPEVRFSVTQPLITYRITDGKPYLAIPSAMGDMFAHFEYNFETKVWMHYS